MIAVTRKQLWLRLLLYPGHTLPTAAAPVLVAVGLAVHDGVFAPWPALLAFLASWFIHVAGVLTDNHTLLQRHPALPEHPELLDAVADRRLVLSTLRGAIWLCLLLAAAVGGYLVWIGGSLALAIGLIGVAASLSYHGGPCPYAPRGWADPIFFLMFGVVAVAATYYVQVVSLAPTPGPWLLRWHPLPATAFSVGLPVGALVTNVLIIDDLRDRHWDAQKGWRTGAVRWGAAWSRTEFSVLMAFAYVAPLPLVWDAGFRGWALLPWLSAPLALWANLKIRRLDGPTALLPWTSRIAALGLVYSGLSGLGLALAGG